MITKAVNSVISLLFGVFIIVTFIVNVGDVLNLGSDSIIEVAIGLSLISLISITLVLNNRILKPSPLNWAVLIWAAYVILNILISSDISSYSYIFLFRVSLLWVFAYYYGYYLGYVSIYSKIRTVFVVVLPILIYLLTQTATLRAALTKTGDFTQINAVFFILVLLPTLLTFKKDKLKYLFLFIVFAACIFSMKRSAIIAAALSVIIYLVGAFKLSKSHIFFKVLSVILVISACLFSFNIINDSYDGYLINRFENIEEGSGRDHIFQDALNGFINLPFIEKIFGRGYNSVLNDNIADGCSAHNDFLEVIYDYGIIGFVLYISIWLAIIRRYKFLAKAKSQMRIPYLISIIIFIVLSSVSHLIIYPSYFVCLSMFWGLVEGVSVKTRGKLLNI